MPTCVSTFGGYEGAIGWIAEAACGDTPVGALTGFGYVQNVDPLYTKGSKKGRQIGSQKLAYERQAKIEAGVTIEYVPVDRTLDSVFLYALGSAGGHTNHLPVRSIERGLVRTDPAGEERELFNMSKVNVLRMETSVGEEWKFTEELMSQYMQHSTSKTYVGFQSVTVGADPAIENDEPLMFYDGDIKVAYFESESFTGITGTSQAVATAPEDVDGDASYDDDVRVYINGVEDIVVSVVGTTVTWTTVVSAPDVIIIEYYKTFVQLTDLTDVSIEVNRNLEALWGITSGLPVAYELVEKAFEVTCSITENFGTDTLLVEALADNPHCLLVEIGTKEVRLLRGKWEGPPGPYTPEDLIAVALDAEYEDVVIT